MNTETEATRKYEPYPHYRESGVEWLGNVPEHWKVDRLRWTVLRCKNGIWGNEPDGADDLVCVRVADFDRTKFRIIIDEPTVRAVTHSERRGRLLQKSDLLLEKSGGGELQPVGAVMLFEHDTDAVCSNFVAKMPVSVGFDSVFLTYLHAHLYARRVNTRSIKQTTGIQNLDSMAYLDERVTYPPIIEQQAIAVFLDRRTGAIDDLIAKKERVIELLREKHTALISHTVTKGLNPDAKMKDSRIDWLGEVPEHWEVLPLRRIVSRFVDYRGKTPEKVLSGIPLITAKNIKNGLIDLDLSKEFIREDEYDSWMVRGLPERGDVLVTTEAPLGESAQIIDPNIALAQRIILLKADRARITNDYLKYHFISRLGQAELWTKASGSTALGIKASRLKGTVACVPPIPEQKDITQHLDRETSKIHALIAKVTEAIGKLKEYRAALISAAVTGKIDVRKEIA